MNGVRTCQLQTAYFGSDESSKLPAFSRMSKNAMKPLFVFALLLGTLLCRATHADTSKHVVRIACVPEAGLLDVESRLLHDSVSGDPDPAGQTERDTRLAEAGFHDPRGLKVSCVLGGVDYLITAQQDQPSNRMCGGDPEVYLTLTRNGDRVLSDVVFGESCYGAPSISRFTIGDGPRSWRGRETAVCYSSGRYDEPDHCDWTFGSPLEFGKRFPIDQARIRRIVAHQERR